MRVFICEFVTGGGLAAEPLPASLVREGRMMRDALARDLAELPGVDVVTTHDDRLAAPDGIESAPIAEGDDPWAVWAAILRDCEIAWLVAPETDGALARLASLARACGVDVIGPDDETIRIASSKRVTAERLRAHGVETPPVWRPGEAPANARGPFVSKPDDGAGCDATRFWNVHPKSADLPNDHVLQPFVAGTPASLTVLNTQAGTRLLSVNRQHVGIENGAFVFRGLSVGALDDPGGRLAALGCDVAAALPGLSGIYGIDIVLNADGPVVIEINPRLTTAYAGLRQALGVNPAALVPPFAALFATKAEPVAARPFEIAL